MAFNGRIAVGEDSYFRVDISETHYNSAPALHTFLSLAGFQYQDEVTVTIKEGKVTITKKK